MAANIRCSNSTCNKPITTKTEVEYSEEYSEFYCNFDCALESFFNRARCSPLDFKDEAEGLERDFKVVDQKLIWRE